MHAPTLAHSLFPTFGSAAVHRSVPSFTAPAGRGGSRRSFPAPAAGGFTAAAAGGANDGWDTEEDDDDDDEMEVGVGSTDATATAAGVELDDVASSSDESLLTDEDEGWGGGGVGVGFGGVAAAAAGVHTVPPLSTEASTALRALKQSPLATAPTEDYLLFESTYATGLGRARKLFAFCSEDVKDGMLSQVEAVEQRAHKAMLVLDAEKDKLVGPEAIARQKKVATLTARLSALDAQVLSNRQSTARDLGEIRESTSTRLSALSRTFAAQARKLEAQLKKEVSSSSGNNSGGGGLASALKAAGLGVGVGDEEEEEASAGVKAGGGGKRKR
ncbi:hypothetical protein JCM6882_009520 [Rhodosporidiobolus microsporus]